MIMLYIQYSISTNWWPIYSGLPQIPLISSNVYYELILNLLEVSF